MNIETKTQQLKNLFERWQKSFPFKENDFHVDGIINEELYEQNINGMKILFIAKEPNATDHEENEDRSFVNEWNTTKPKYNFAQRIAEWTYGIMEHFPLFDSIKENDKPDYLKKIAFMNVKKSGGDGFAIRNDIYTVVKEQKNFIKEEIEIIKPDIILLCISFDKNIIKDLFGELEFKKSGYGVEICMFNNSKVINFYHPSSRNVAPAAYSLLQNVIQSEAFKTL